MEKPQLCDGDTFAGTLCQVKLIQEILQRHCTQSSFGCFCSSGFAESSSKDEPVEEGAASCFLYCALLIVSIYFH